MLRLARMLLLLAAVFLGAFGALVTFPDPNPAGRNRVLADPTQCRVV